MSGAESASTFTESLLSVIRQQRHLATRVVIATQEPTISSKLLELSSLTVVHRFTSPSWLQTLKAHLAGVSSMDESSNRNVSSIFNMIVNLQAGQALLFSPCAMLDMKAEGDMVKLGTRFVKIKIRKRLTTDGGRSIMAA